MLEVNNDAVTLTRSELYARVWAQPIQHAAREFAVSDVGLSKICRRANIPCPPRGYWAKLGAGKKVERRALPPAADETVVIHAVRKPEYTFSAKAEYVRLRQSYARVTVPTTLDRPHRALADPAPAASTFEASVLVQRRVRILDTIFREAERMGFTAKTGDHTATWLELGLRRIELSLRQHVEQIRRPIEGYPHRFTIDPQPTGLLALTIKSPLRLQLETKWIEEPSHLLESSIAEILATLGVAKLLLHKRQQDDEAEEAAEATVAQQVQQEERRQDNEERSWDRFLELAEQSEKADKARAFIAKLEAAPHGEGGGALLAWAKERLAAYDPLAGASAQRRPALSKS